MKLKLIFTILFAVLLIVPISLAYSACDADFDESGKVDFNDFFMFSDYFGTTDPKYDINKNGKVDFDDHFIFADFFGQQCDANKDNDGDGVKNKDDLYPDDPNRASGNDFDRDGTDDEFDSDDDNDGVADANDRFSKDANRASGNDFDKDGIDDEFDSDDDNDRINDDRDRFPNDNKRASGNDFDKDGTDDEFDSDDDNDGVADASDRFQKNANRASGNDFDRDGTDDEFDSDDDNDGVADASDRLPKNANRASGNDFDRDGTDDEFDSDDDNDGVTDANDRFPNDNKRVSGNDFDKDGIDDEFDNDDDNDKVTDALDNYPNDNKRASGNDSDNDGTDDELDNDDDNDGVADASDKFPNDNKRASGNDSDNDGTDDEFDSDDDNDGISDAQDNCPRVSNSDQADFDRDGIGDLCDPDVDGDGHSASAGDCDDNPYDDNVQYIFNDAQRSYFARIFGLSSPPQYFAPYRNPGRTEAAEGDNFNEDCRGEDFLEINRAPDISVNRITVENGFWRYKVNMRDIISDDHTAFDKLTIGVVSFPYAINAEYGFDGPGILTLWQNSGGSNMDFNVAIYATDETGSRTDKTIIIHTVQGPCRPDWHTSEFGSCQADGKVYRDVWDTNGCNTEEGKPAASQPCPAGANIPALWATLSNQAISEDSADGTVAYPNLKSRCTDADDPVNINVISSHPFSLYWQGNDLLVSGLPANFNSNVLVRLGCNGIESSFILSVGEVNDPPSIDSISPSPGSITIIKGQTQAFSASVSDVDTSASSVIKKWYIDSNEVSTGDSFSFTPTLAQLGSHTLEFRARDEESTVTRQWSVQVIEVGMAVQSLTMQPKAMVGNQITIASSIANVKQGTQSSTAKLFIDADTNPAASVQINNLNPGSTQAISFNYAFATTGTHNVKVKVDALSGEEDTNDNEYSGSILIKSVQESVALSISAPSPQVKNVQFNIFVDVWNILGSAIYNIPITLSKVGDLTIPDVATKTTGTVSTFQRLTWGNNVANSVGTVTISATTPGLTSDANDQKNIVVPSSPVIGIDLSYNPRFSDYDTGVNFYVYGVVSNSGNESARNVDLSLTLPAGISTNDPVTFRINELGIHETKELKWLMEVKQKSSGNFVFRVVNYDYNTKANHNAVTGVQTSTNNAQPNTIVQGNINSSTQNLIASANLTTAVAPAVKEQAKLPKKEKAKIESISVDDIAVDSSSIGVSGMVPIRFTINNPGSKKMKDVKIAATFMELDYRVDEGPFSIGPGKSVTKELLMDIPSGLEPGEYVIRYSIYADGAYTVRHRPIIIY